MARGRGHDDISALNARRALSGELTFAEKRLGGDEYELHAYLDGRHAGILEFYLDDPWGQPSDDTALLAYVYVHPEYRRQGIARQLADQFYARHGSRRFLFGDATESGHAFALSIGAERFCDDNYDHEDGHYGERCPICHRPDRG